MQFDALSCTSVASKLPLEVTAVTAHDNALYAATKTGLLVYKPSDGGRQEVVVLN